MRILGLIAATALFLTACGGGDGDEAAPDESAGGTTITAEGFTYLVPDGWKDITDRIGDGFLSAVGDTKDKDGFADNINVSNMATAEIDLGQTEDSAKSELEDVGATDVTILERTKVGGVESAHISANTTAQGATYHVDQYYTLVGDTGYIVTYSTSPDLSDADREDVITPILASFDWR